MKEQVQSVMKRGASVKGINLIKVGAVYLVAGLSLGVAMGVAHDFTLSSVHAHILLLGWVTMVITGLVYIILPGCEKSWLASVHFWGLNAGLPLMICGLVLLSFNKSIGEKIVAPGAVVSLAAVLAFTINVFLNGLRAPLWSRD